MHAFEMRCYQRLLNISYKNRVTYEEGCRQNKAAIGEYDELLALVKKRKLKCFGHVSKYPRLAKMIGTQHRDEETDRKIGGKTILKMDWNGFLRDFLPTLASSTKAAENKTRWKGTVTKSSVVPRRPSKVME